jgi:hypothetical protein
MAVQEHGAAGGSGLDLDPGIERDRTPAGWSPARSVRIEFAPMSASSYSRVLNRNRLRTHSSTTSAAAEINTTQGRRQPARARTRAALLVSAVWAVSAVSSATAVSRSLFRPTGRFPYRGMLGNKFLSQTMTV